MSQGKKRQQDRQLLDRLVQIKERKEQSFRRQMGQLNRQKQELTDRIENLLQKRIELQQRIHDFRITQEILTLTELSQHRARVVRWYNQERNLADLQLEVEEQRQILQQEIDEVQRAMLRVIKSQEKLQVVINEYSNASQRG